MSRPLSVCSAPGCATLVAGGRCALHPRQMPPRERQPIHGSSRWRRLSLAFLGDHPLCIGYPRDAHGAYPTMSEVADHVIPVRERSDLQWDVTNLQPLCRECHQRKTADEQAGRITGGAGPSRAPTIPAGTGWPLCSIRNY